MVNTSVVKTKNNPNNIIINENIHVIEQQFTL